MRKNLVKGMAALCMCAAFASCSHDTDFEAPSQIELTKNEYKANFIKRYGEIDPNQTWDFTDLTKSAMTRGTATILTLNLYNGFQTSVSNDKKIVEQQTDFTTGISTFNPYFSADLYAAFSHAKSGEKYDYYHLGIYQNGQVTEIPAQINVKNGWYDRGNGGALNQNSGRRVNTKSMTGDNIKFVAYPTRPTKGTKDDKDWNTYVANNMDQYVVENYKVMTVGERTYWCFDCNNDKDYSDLIFQVVSYESAPAVWKRYMIEDLGGTKDFDFNDIVVDVYQDYATSSQKAIIRAMGGTFDFTLKIGDTTWSKSGNGFDAATMYNTLPTPEWDKNLAEFSVTGWNPASNNVSVTVENRSSTGVLTEVDIPFPKAGEVPMIIAVYPLLVDWMLEYKSIPTDFFYEITVPTEE
jgi:hypothetical protein